VILVPKLKIRPARYAVYDMLVILQQSTFQPPFGSRNMTLPCAS